MWVPNVTTASESKWSSGGLLYCAIKIPFISRFFPHNGGNKMPQDLSAAPE